MTILKKVSKPIIWTISLIILAILGLLLYLKSKKNKNGIISDPLLGNSRMDEMPMVKDRTLYELLEDLTVWDNRFGQHYSFLFRKGTLFHNLQEVSQPLYVGTYYSDDKIFTDEEAKNVDFALVPKFYNFQKSSLDINKRGDLAIKKSLLKLKSKEETEQYELNLLHSKADTQGKVVRSNIDYIFSFKESFDCDVTDFSPGDYELNYKKIVNINDKLEAKTLFTIPDIKFPSNSFIDLLPESPNYEYFIKLKIGKLLYSIPSSKLSSIKEKFSVPNS